MFDGIVTHRATDRVKPGDAVCLLSDGTVDNTTPSASSVSDTLEMLYGVCVAKVGNLASIHVGQFITVELHPDKVSDFESDIEHNTIIDFGVFDGKVVPDSTAGALWDFPYAVIGVDHRDDGRVFLTVLTDFGGHDIWRQ